MVETAPRHEQMHAPSPGVLALSRFHTIAARTSLMRAPQVLGAHMWRTPEPGARLRQRARNAALGAAAMTAFAVGSGWLWSGWTPELLLAFPLAFGVLMWLGGDEQDVAPERAMTRVAVTVAPDRLRVEQDGELQVDAPWSEVQVWGFGEWQPPQYRHPNPPEVRELRLSGPDGRAVTLDTFMFPDRAPVDAITWHLCQHGRLLLDEREWIVRR